MTRLSSLASLRRIGGAYRQVFAGPAGRIVLKDLIRTVGLYQQSGAIDTAELQYREGARDLVRRVLKMAKGTDAQLEQMMGEAVDD